jgi:RecA-family ATPase
MNTNTNAARPLGDLRTRQPGDDAELLKHGYLRRGDGMLIAGPAGGGKSSLAVQLMICWALGREVFGIEPTRSLRSLLIQADNSEGDLAEMRDGALRGMAFTPEEAATATGAIVVLTEYSRTGPAFFDLLCAALEAHRPDLLWIDPLSAYLGDVSNEKVCAMFLRNQLNPLLHQFGCAAIVVHHGNKPADSYLDGSQLGCWLHSVFAIRTICANDVLELTVRKRGLHKLPQGRNET